MQGLLFPNQKVIHRLIHIFPLWLSTSIMHLLGEEKE
jgi:hypothetical protein